MKAFSYEEKENPKFGLCGKTPRHIMQTLGTEWGRKLIGDDIWLEVMLNRIRTTRSKTIIIDDCRFENEADLVHSLGGVVVQIERPGITYGGGHASEKPLPDRCIDMKILNETEEGLRETARFWNPFL